MTDTELVIDGCPFAYGPMYGNSTSERLFIIKPAPLLRRYLELMNDTRGGAIVELGIAQGGSAAAAALVARPTRLVAIDISEPLDPLTDFIGAHHLEDVLRAYYRIDQSDKEALNRIAGAEFGNTPIDLVVDDASHRFEPTAASFEVLFPRLREGGKYLIEDWHVDIKWTEAFLDTLTNDVDSARNILTMCADPEHRAHTMTATAVNALLLSNRPPANLQGLVDELSFPAEDLGFRPLFDIIRELTALQGLYPEFVRGITVKPDWIVVERGPGVPPEDWRLTTWPHLTHPGA